MICRLGSRPPVDRWAYCEKFDNHFFPDKLPPPEVVMFTGTQSRDERRCDHPAQFQRMLDWVELPQHRVDQPSRSFHPRSVMFGLILISFGPILLVLVAVEVFA